MAVRGEALCLEESMSDRKQLERLVKKGERFRNTPIVDDDFVVVKDDFDSELFLARRHLNKSRPTVVCLCGGTRFYEAFQKANYDETMAGRVVLSVGFYPHSADKAHGEAVGIPPGEFEAVKSRLDELHLRKIDLADEVLVLNVGGYVGDSTRREIAHAVATGKPVRYLEPIAEGK